MDEKARAESALNKAATREPILLGTAIVNFVAAAIATAAVMGLDLTGVQQDAIWQCLGAGSILLWTASGFMRQSVVSPATHLRKVEEAAISQEAEPANTLVTPA